MATTKFVNRARMLTSTTGTGSSITLTTAIAGYFTFAEAGLQDGDVVDYIIEQGADFEIQHDQTYSSTGPSLSRGTPAASKVGGTAGTSKIDLNGTAQVAIVAVAKSLDVGTFTDKTTPILADLLWGLDSVSGQRRKFSLANLFKASTINLQVFTSNGTYTPTAGLRYALMIATGGGGGGGGADCTDSSAGTMGGGGGAGATAIGVFSASTIGASRSITIGAGGTAGSDTGGNGGNGGTTTVSELLSAGGGFGGEGIAANNHDRVANGGSGGSATVGALLIAGGGGGAGTSPFTSTGIIHSGVGGASFWGGGGRGQAINTGVSIAGEAGRAYGSGGSGAVSQNTTGAAGGAGANGVVVILEFC